MQLLDEDDPIAALRLYLDGIPGPATRQESQIALGSAQLMLFPIEREQRGGEAVQALIDLVLSRWGSFSEPAGFHAQGFVRNAIASVGADRARLDRLLALVSADPSPELQYHIACAYACVGDKPAMLEAVRTALASGASVAQIRRDHDFVAFADDPELARLLDRAETVAIPVDVAPHLAPVRMAFDAVVSTLRGFGEHGRLNPPASLDLVLATERAWQLQLPNDYRALLMIADGMTLWENEFFGTRDYRAETQLAESARAYFAASAAKGTPGIHACVPLANWGQPADWLLYDPRGALRGGAPGYVLRLGEDKLPVADLVSALERIEQTARDVLGTN